MDLSGYPVLLDNLKYYSRYTKLFYIHILRKTNREKLHVCLSNICSAIREFLTYIQHTGRPCPQGHSYCNQLKLNPVLHCKLRKQPGYFAR